jgi:hypothetical protein
MTRFRTKARGIECIGFEGFNQVKFEGSNKVLRGGPNTSYSYARGAQSNLIWVMKWEENTINETQESYYNLETTSVATFSFCF